MAYEYLTESSIYLPENKLSVIELNLMTEKAEEEGKSSLKALGNHIKKYWKRYLVMSAIVVGLGVAIAAAHKNGDKEGEKQLRVVQTKAKKQESVLKKMATELKVSFAKLSRKPEVPMVEIKTLSERVQRYELTAADVEKEIRSDVPALYTKIVTASLFELNNKSINDALETTGKPMSKKEQKKTYAKNKEKAKKIADKIMAGKQAQQQSTAYYRNFGNGNGGGGKRRKIHPRSA